MASAGKIPATFSCQYTDAQGKRVTERPRLMVTADRKHKSLWIGAQERPTVLATTPYDAPDAELWLAARQRYGGM